MQEDSQLPVCATTGVNPDRAHVRHVDFSPLLFVVQNCTAEPAVVQQQARRRSDTDSDALLGIALREAGPLSVSGARRGDASIADRAGGGEVSASLRNGSVHPQRRIAVTVYRIWPARNPYRRRHRTRSGG